MIIKKFEFNPFPVNTYVLHDEKTLECAIIDPGCYFGEEEDELLDYIKKNNLKVKYLLSTHMHLDHNFGAPFVAETFGVKSYACKLDAKLGEMAEEMAMRYGMKLPRKSIPIDIDIKEGDHFALGDQVLEAIHVPGHSPGSIVFYDKAGKFMIAGDVLFRGSIGRTDLPGGDYNTLITGIKTKLFSLPNDTVIYSGHGPETNIDFEKKNNPFLT